MSYSPTIKCFEIVDIESSVCSAYNTPKEGRGYFPFLCIRGYACHILGSQTSLEIHFLSKIFYMNFPFLGKIFSNYKFLGFSSIVPQNKFLVIKFMTKIRQ